jgi:hypothetical protein
MDGISSFGSYKPYDGRNKGEFLVEGSLLLSFAKNSSLSKIVSLLELELFRAQE